MQCTSDEDEIDILRYFSSILQILIKYFSNIAQFFLFIHDMTLGLVGHFMNAPLSRTLLSLNFWGRTYVHLQMEIWVIVKVGHQWWRWGDNFPRFWSRVTSIICHLPAATSERLKFKSKVKEAEASYLVLSLIGFSAVTQVCRTISSKRNIVQKQIEIWYRNK